MKRNLNIKGTVVLDKNLLAKKRLVVNEGGSRSSKTYSIAQRFIIKGLEEKGQVYSIVRKTLPALKATALKDFIEVLKNARLWNPNNFNKTDLVYHLNGNEFEFFSADDPQKLRGRKRKDLWTNETNELSYEDYKQLAMRTSGQIFMDYNPSDEFHWIYDHILIRDDAEVIKSTYKDNPFLEDNIIREIEQYKDLDQNYWKIYGLGERGTSQATIFTHWKFAEIIPEFDEDIYGLDFGFNNATALVNIGIKDQATYWDEILYRSGLTNYELGMHMLGWERMTESQRQVWLDSGKSQSDNLNLNIPFNKPIYADSAEKQRIIELQQLGFWVIPAKKDVKDGIDKLKITRIFITKSSINILKEIKSYKWKQKDDKILDEPVKVNDHAMDAGRYAIFSHSNQPFIGIV